MSETEGNNMPQPYSHDCRKDFESVILVESVPVQQNPEKDVFSSTRTVTLNIIPEDVVKQYGNLVAMLI